MHVLLLATDEQPQLSLLTDTIPGPLLPIVNRPVMAVTVEILSRAGYKDLLVSLCNRGGSIASYFGSGSRWGVRIEYVIQREGWGSAGALAWAAELLTETVLVLPADAIIDLDIEAALAFHRAHGGAATMILRHPGDRSVTQPVAIDAQGQVRGIEADPAAGKILEHTGAYIFEPQVLQFIPARTQLDSYSQLVPSLIAAGVAVHGYRMAGYWNKLDSMSAYQDAQKVFLYSAYDRDKLSASAADGDAAYVRYPSIEGQQIAPGIWVGHNHIIHPSARLAPPLCIGDGSRIGYGVELGPEVVIGTNVVIDDEATIYQSTVLDHTYVGQLVNISNRVIHKTILIDTVTSESTVVVDKFLLDETRLTSTSGRLRRALACLVAGVLLVATLPLTLLISVVVAIRFGGRVFTRSLRVGQAAQIPMNQPTVAQTFDMNQPIVAQTFDLFAFQTRQRDGTLSGVGRWLQRWGWDRFPELWNVLRGDLELVGVKPLSQDEAILLNEAWQQKRYECSPGLTGLWYIQTNAESDLEEILVADAYYVATHTWRDDIKVLWHTPAAWLRRSRHPRVLKVNDSDFSGQMDNISSL